MGRGPLVYLGTGEFAVPLLEDLVATGEEVALVVTQPERPRGRGRKPMPTPVGEVAARLDLPVATPASVNDPEFVAGLRALGPEFLALADFGQFLGGDVLRLAPGGAINLHPSLLPRWRGPAPIAWPIINGDRQTGASVMVMDSGMDTGPVLSQVTYPIDETTTAGELSEALAIVGSRLFVETLGALRRGVITPAPQDDAAATLSKMIGREWFFADWSLEPAAFARRVNGLSPRPGVRGLLGGKLVKFLRAVVGVGKGEPGTVLAATAAGVTVACGGGAVTLLEVLPEGRKPMRAADFANSGAVARGMAFTSADVG